MTMERESPGNREIRKEMIDYNGIYSFPYYSFPIIIQYYFIVNFGILEIHIFYNLQLLNLHSLTSTEALHQDLSQ